MALSDLYSNVLISARWLHVLLGIVWLGNLYFFDFVMLPMESSLGARARRFMFRAVSWFRWSATVAVASGVVLLMLFYLYSPEQGFGPTQMLVAGQTITDRAIWILFGMSLAILMWFQVWFIAGPAQLKLLKKSATGDEVPILRRRSAAAVRMATL